MAASTVLVVLEFARGEMATRWCVKKCQNRGKLTEVILHHLERGQLHGMASINADESEHVSNSFYGGPSVCGFSLHPCT
jgi:hypothetical protein